jgi:Mrp family chromosome partitioning ATPase
VVDANVRNPDLTGRLNTPPDLGWTGDVGGRTPRTRRTAQTPALPIRATSIRQLSFLPAPLDESDLDRSQIDELRKAASLVLLDAPSLAHEETLPLLRCCDGVYLVVRLGHTARRAVADAARLLRASGCRLLGYMVVE